jgi:hypothetical protein
LLASTPSHQRDETFRRICADAHTIDEPVHHNELGVALLYMGKRFLINRSDESVRATVVGELNKVVPFPAARPSAARCDYIAVANERPNSLALSTITTFEFLVREGDSARLEAWLARQSADEVALLLQRLGPKR